MPQIRPITDLRNTNDISDACHAVKEPIFITKNGYGEAVIMSLEAYEEMMETAKTIAKLKPDGVKIHMLCALEGTPLAEMYRLGELSFMDEDEYVSTVCDFLEYLPPTTTIHRLAGNGLRTELVAPRWIGRKLDTLNRIDREFLKRNSKQGTKYQ